MCNITPLSNNHIAPPTGLPGWILAALSGSCPEAPVGRRYLQSFHFRVGGRSSGRWLGRRAAAGGPGQPGDVGKGAAGSLGKGLRRSVSVLGLALDPEKTFTSPYLAQQYYPAFHQPHCTTYRAPRVDLARSFWSCPKPLSVDAICSHSTSAWEAALRAGGSDDELRLVDQASLEMSARGLPEV
ncbi:hypothetical protein HPB52_012779 [Rhipicephalus sanguineus]|uniref:Uncharacterized protein n=1 Tax=Rhipicephalus sanguineus TaxID=34632 RepID=A0A9D4SPQ8_RHISA|nr:hypothetical protein HPB52_012779 [Rhipicephalus sanguineus]